MRVLLATLVLAASQVSLATEARPLKIKGDFPASLRVSKVSIEGQYEHSGVIPGYYDEQRDEWIPSYSAIVYKTNGTTPVFNGQIQEFEMRLDVFNVQIEGHFYDFTFGSLKVESTGDDGKTVVSRVTLEPSDQFPTDNYDIWVGTQAVPAFFEPSTMIYKTVGSPSGVLPQPQPYEDASVSVDLRSSGGITLNFKRGDVRAR